MSGYIVCTTPRSGSTLLCTLLAATGRAGQPWSYYHQPDFMQEWADAWHLSDEAGSNPLERDAAYLAAVVLAGRGGTPVFGMRLQHAYLALLRETLVGLFAEPLSDAERFSRAFGPVRYVHLTRDDKVAQALSLVVARQTGLWHRNADGSERERSLPPAEPVYDHRAVKAEVARLSASDQGWRAWFVQQRIEPFHVSYETLARDPIATVLDLCAALAIDLPDVPSLQAGTARLDSIVNLAWIRRFRDIEGG